MLLVVYVTMRFDHSHCYGHCRKNDVEALPKTYKQHVRIQNNSFNEKYGYMEIDHIEEPFIDATTSALIHIPLYHSDKNTIGFAGIILVTIQCFIMILSIYPTEKALKKHFNDDGIPR